MSKGRTNTNFPLTFTDIGLWLTVQTIILLITAELMSPYYKKVKILIDKKRLRKAAAIVSIVFFLVITIQIIEMMI